MDSKSKDEISNNNWAITTERYVTFIDIMGFKDLVLRNTHDDIYKLMKKLDSKKRINENIKWGDIETKLVKTTTYSDSIMIYSKDSSRESLRAIVSTTAALTYDLFMDEIPHKGAFAFGLMTLDSENSIFFGQPLIDAFLLQEELAFYGIAMHASAENELHKKEYLNQGFLKSYLCPFKSGSATHLTIRPMYSIDLTGERKEIKELLFKAINRLRFKTSGHLRKYIDSTEAYMKSLSDQ